MKHNNATTNEYKRVSRFVETDPAIQVYFDHIRSTRGNKGILPHSTQIGTVSAVRHFLAFTGLEQDNKSLSKLVAYKQANPTSHDIEQQVKAFSLILSAKGTVKHSHVLASCILGIFKHNYAQLQTKVYNHFDPAEENCTDGIFLDIYKHLDQESKDMIQWNIYAPERAVAAYEIQFSDIDLSRADYAILNMQSERTKAKVKHPCLVPIDFAKRIIYSAQAAQRNCPFPNHKSAWKKITAFANTEYKVRLVSNRCRKFFEDKADDSTLPASIAAFLMGDKTKLNATGHLPLFYNMKLKFIERIAQEYTKSNVVKLLTLNQSTN